MATQKDFVVKNGIIVNQNITIAGKTHDRILDSADVGSVAAGEAINLEVVTVQETLDTDNIIVIDGDYTTSAAMELVVEATGNRQITLANAAITNDDFVVIYDDGTDTHVGILNISATATTFAAGSVWSEICTIKGLSDATALHADNFIFG